jgi:hypothetical protein
LDRMEMPQDRSLISYSVVWVEVMDSADQFFLV